MVSGPRLETPAGLLARWGIPADAELARAERGSNNQTFAVAHGGVRWVLRISQNLSAAQARAEHRLLGKVRAAGLPFGVPEPVATLSGNTVAEMPAGPATLCRWMPGVRPDLAAEPELERFGQAIGLLSRALAPVPWSDAPQDWRGDPLRAHPDAPQAAELARALRGAGVPAARVRRLEIAARHVLPWAPETGGDLPVQIVHGDLGASNVLVDERTGEVTGVLDFELAGPGRGSRTSWPRCCSPARWPDPGGRPAPLPWSAGTPRCSAWIRPRSWPCRTCSCPAASARCSGGPAGGTAASRR